MADGRLTSFGDVVENVEARMRCVQCREYFDADSRKPRFLDCLHCICESCASCWLRERDSVVCRSCGRGTELPNGEVENLRPNEYVYGYLLFVSRSNFRGQVRMMNMPKLLLTLRDTVESWPLLLSDDDDEVAAVDDSPSPAVGQNRGADRQVSLREAACQTSDSDFSVTGQLIAGLTVEPPSLNSGSPQHPSNAPVDALVVRHVPAPDGELVIRAPPTPTTSAPRTPTAAPGGVADDGGASKVTAGQSGALGYLLGGLRVIQVLLALFVLLVLFTGLNILVRESRFTEDDRHSILVLIVAFVLLSSVSWRGFFVGSVGVVPLAVLCDAFAGGRRSSGEILFLLALVLVDFAYIHLSVDSLVELTVIPSIMAKFRKISRFFTFSSTFTNNGSG